MEAKQNLENELRDKETVCALQDEQCRTMKEFFQNEDGMGVVEIVLIIVVLIGLVLVFKTQINSIVKTLLNNMKNDALAI